MSSAPQATVTIAGGPPVTRENLPHTIARLALPAVGENLLTTMVFLVDTLLVGWLKDPAALAAVSLGGMFLNIANQLFTAVSVAATAMVAHAWGAREQERARRIAAHGILVGVIFAALAILAMWPSADSLLTLMGASERATFLGSQYMRIILLTSLLGFPMVVLNGIMRGSGDTRTPMLITLAMNLWNVVVSIVLTFGLGPVPALGLVGAAWGTASARLLGGAIALYLVMSGKRFLRLRWRDILQPDRATFAQMLRLSLPAGGESIIMRLGFVLFMRIVSSLGEAPLAAHQIAVNVESLSYMPGFGLSVASTTLVGQSLGARRPDLAEESIRVSMRVALVVMGVLGCIFALFGPALAALFGSTPEVVALAGSAIRIGALEQLPIAIQMVISGSLRGAGDTRTPMYATLLGVLLFRVPAVYFFAVLLRLGLNGVWLGTALDWAARAGVLYWLFRRGTWKRTSLWNKPGGQGAPLV
ncbi:MAG TPA: MATE family efflux transporter [Anaerolineae bacterium]|nr:MATE family efflux transporter [Anaerolineae bacterium]HNT04842.1 MATE family efflux transporter [Anaerolineae bacterium]